LSEVANSPSQAAANVGWSWTDTSGPRLKNQGYSSSRMRQGVKTIVPGCSGARVVVERSRPYRRIGSATTKPAIGPATPMSNRARRSVKGDRMRMTAPKVPNRFGPGRKNGRVASMP